jgi:ATP-dependent DNA helicase RecG
VLLFARKDPTRWHPRCGIEFVRWEGKERKTGAELNITKRIRMEAPLVRLVEEAFRTIQQLTSRSVSIWWTSSLKSGLPIRRFAWQEAIVNAVAHRDYRLQGHGH